MLANGLTVAVIADHAAPVVSTALWYRAGTAHESASHGGVAHFLEHMMFKGSPRFAAGEIDRLTLAVGGSNNAYTSHDSTVYLFSLPAAHWRLALEIEADRMAGIDLETREIDAEREVVLEEVGEVENDPWSALELAVNAAFFGDHPYGRRILGSRDSLAALGRAEVAAFHRQLYLPENAVLTVAGAVGDEVTAVAEELFGGVARGPAAATPSTTAVAPRASQRRVSVARGKTARGLFAAPGPATASADFVALRLALTTLCSGRASRLQRILVDDGKLCQSVASGLTETVAAGMASIAVELVPGVESDRVEQTVRRELQAACRHGLEDDAVERARRLLLSDWLFSHETIEQRGETAGAGLALFGADHARRHYRQLVETTAELAHEALCRYFAPWSDGVVGWAGV